jgi:3-oxoacyl-(acyl-carrier-protein) synthase
MEVSENIMRRVVVTGLGLVTPLGADVETAWANLLAGKSGAGRSRSSTPRARSA